MQEQNLFSIKVKIYNIKRMLNTNNYNDNYNE